VQVVSVAAVQGAATEPGLQPASAAVLQVRQADELVAPGPEEDHLLAPHGVQEDAPAAA